MSLTNNLPPTTYTFNISSWDQLNNLSFEQLAKLKSQIDNDLSTLFAHLSSLNADMNTSLLTLDNYPRSDIDVVAIRLTRSKIIHLQNDYKWISETLLNKMNEKLNSSTSM